PARQDDAFRTPGGDLGRVVVPGPDLAVHPDLADAAGDQLGVLGAEVQDQDFVAVDVLEHGIGDSGLGIESGLAEHRASGQPIEQSGTANQSGDAVPTVSTTAVDAIPNPQSTIPPCRPQPAR